MLSMYQLNNFKKWICKMQLSGPHLCCDQFSSIPHGLSGIESLSHGQYWNILSLQPHPNTIYS